LKAAPDDEEEEEGREPELDDEEEARAEAEAEAEAARESRCLSWTAWAAWILYTALSYRTWKVRNSEINMTVRKTTANFGRDTPTTRMQSVGEASGPAGRIADFGSHLQEKIDKNRKASISFWFWPWFRFFPTSAPAN